MPKINALAEVETAEVSLVPRGANLRNRFAMLKAEDPMKLEKIMKAILELEAENEAQLDALAKEGQISGKAVEAMKGMLRIAQAFKDELPKDAISMLAKLAQMEEPEDEKEPDEEKPADEDKKPAEGELGKEAEMLKSDGTLNLEAVPEALRPTVELLHKQATDSQKTIVALQKDLDGERGARIDREMRELVEKEAPHAPGVKKDEVIALLKKADEKDRGTLLDILRAASKASEESQLLTQKAHPGDSGGDAWSKIQEVAKGIVEKSEKPLQMAEAIDRVLQDPRHADLYNQYIAEHGE